MKMPAGSDRAELYVTASRQKCAAIQDVFDEMNRAKDKHGDNYMGNMPDNPNPALFLELVSLTGRYAKLICESGTPTRMAVLMEEVGEVADALMAGEDPRPELVQAAAMPLAWIEALS